MRFAGSAAMASGMAGSAAADALMPNNCFVAGTPVWVLRDGVDAQTANAALAEGASWEDFAEQKPIEEVEAGDYALSRPEDDADRQLRFMPVTETYTNTTEEVVELWVVNYATGEQDHLTTTPGHPFWVDTGDSAGEPGRRSLGEGGWTFAAELTVGDTLRNADGRSLTVASARHETCHQATYNFCVAEDHTYHVGLTTTWVHNASRTYITYTAIDADTGRVYVGRTSGFGTPEEILRTRVSNHHRNLKPGSAKVDWTTKSYAVARGREQMLANKYGRRLTDQIRPISDRNPNKARYMQAAKRSGKARCWMRRRPYPKPGDVFQIKLPSGEYAYARAFEGAGIGIYAKFPSSPISGVGELTAVPLAFQCFATTESFRMREWPLVGKLPFVRGESPWIPPTYHQDMLDERCYFIHDKGRIKKASRDECMGLAEATVYQDFELIDLIQRFRKGDRSMYLGGRIRKGDPQRKRKV